MSGRIDAQMLDQEKSEEEEQKEPLRVEIDKDQKKTTVDICTLNKDAEKRKVHNDKINIVMFDQQGLKSCCVFMRKKNCSNCELCKFIALILSVFTNVVLIVFIVIAFYDKLYDDPSGKSSQISSPQKLVQNEEGNRPHSVCVKCNIGDQKLQRQLHTVSGLSSSDLCCKEDVTSVKILTTLIASERKRQKTEDYLFLYFPSYVNNRKLHASLSKPRRNSKDALKTVLKSDSLVSYPGNKIIVEKTGTYVIFIALTQTSIRQGDVSVCIIRFREREEKLLRVSMQTRRGILTYNAAHVSEVFHLKSGDSIVIQMKGEENLYTLKESNYFGLYRVS